MKGFCNIYIDIFKYKKYSDITLLERREKMFVVCLDLEGVLVPEIWINVAEKTGIEKLRLTTRDIPDYDVLMKGRIEILKEHGLTLKDIQDVIATMKPACPQFRPEQSS